MERLIEGVRPLRREYSEDFKASVLKQAREPGASVSGVAIRHGLHPNMVHRWWREHRQKPERAREAEFVQLCLPAQVDAGRSTESVAAAPDGGDECIRVEIQRAGSNITVHWPLKAAAHCVQLLGALLR